MQEPLTGRAAAEALGVYFRLGSAGARFDAKTVARAVRTRGGRTLVLRSLSRALSASPVGRVARSALRARTGTRRLRTAVSSSAPPGRPGASQEDDGWIYVGTPSGPPFENDWNSGCRPR